MDLKGMRPGIWKIWVQILRLEPLEQVQISQEMWSFKIVSKARSVTADAFEQSLHYQVVIRPALFTCSAPCFGCSFFRLPSRHARGALGRSMWKSLEDQVQMFYEGLDEWWLDEWWLEEGWFATYCIGSAPWISNCDRWCRKALIQHCKNFEGQSPFTSLVWPAMPLYAMP